MHTHAHTSTARSVHLERDGKSQLGMLGVDYLLRFVVDMQTELPQFFAHVAASLTRTYELYQGVGATVQTEHSHWSRAKWIHLR